MGNGLGARDHVLYLLFVIPGSSSSKEQKEGYMYLNFGIARGPLFKNHQYHFSYSFFTLFAMSIGWSIKSHVHVYTALVTTHLLPPSDDNRFP